MISLHLSLISSGMISALEVKALSEDFKVVAELRNRTRSETGLNTVHCRYQQV